MREASRNDDARASSPSVGEQPALLSPPRMSCPKERRNPSITPRKFRRFFTPRSRVPTHQSPARQALRDLAAPNLNIDTSSYRYTTPAPSSPLNPPSENGEQDENTNLATATMVGNKRRKTKHNPITTPTHRQPGQIQTMLRPSSPGGSWSGLLSPIRSTPSSSQKHREDDEDSEADEDDNPSALPPLQRLRPLPRRGLAGQILYQRLGGLPQAGHSHLPHPAADWRMETADFCSNQDNMHPCYVHCNSARVGDFCIPFCTTACHTTNLTAVGDEEGCVRFLDSSPGANIQEPVTVIKPHNNALIDLDFSNDDRLLATASGDQTGIVLDVMSSQPIACFKTHTASLKQIRFQPGNANHSVLATSARDGTIQIWDLRCSRSSVQAMAGPGPRANGLEFRRPTTTREGYAVNTFIYAHRTPRSAQLRPASSTNAPSAVPSAADRPAGRASDASVTALQFMPSGQENLLLSACDSDAAIKLWDIRCTRSTRRQAVPLSTTAVPDLHSSWRHFGITSLALNSDGSRLYAACKDHTIYAYSTAHLIMGSAPELAVNDGNPPCRPRFNTTGQGMGPLYGFRNHSLFLSSFYIKCAVRPARDGQNELLAVGSSDNCAILFPTSERYFPSVLNKPQDPVSWTPRNSKMDTIPILNWGTRLTKGHRREVGALTWTKDGQLITVADDYHIRSWAEDRQQAAHLRRVGESLSGGDQPTHGWAEVEEDWDREDDDED
ncbi:WD40-repeat-containing domain protein [Xylariomycetidae sp. FL0641]|nr:WD40-repeat-containing domain protein [Xylariomycetidae sp. FL0641]